MTTTPQDLAGAVLTIDLVALQGQLAPVDATRRGCRMRRRGQRQCLWPGDRTRSPRPCGRPAAARYFVARPKEGEELRGLLPDATIYVLDGLFAGQAEFYAKLNLCPALISIEEAREWAGFGRVYGRKLPCALHVDTGINRLGFSMAEFDALLDDAFTDGRPQCQSADEPSRLRR